MELELTIVKPGAESDYYYPLKRHARHFLVTTAAINYIGTDNQQIADKEMSNLQPIEYVSLKNLPPPTPRMKFPAFKDPIVRHAASAYLMPGMAGAASPEPGLTSRAKDVCNGCVRGFLHDVVWSIIRSIFSKNWNNADVIDGERDGDGDREVD